MVSRESSQKVASFGRQLEAVKIFNTRIPLGFYLVETRDHNSILDAVYIWVFPKIGIPQNGWFIMENPIKMDDLGVSLFSETAI